MYQNQMVSINSPQTTKKVGLILEVENARNWGLQYLVEVKDEFFGYEVFWMRDWELKPRFAASR
jgi:hypothetical protein